MSGRRVVPWIRAGGVGIALAGFAWVVPWRVDASAMPLFGDVPVGATAALAALIAGVVVTRLVEGTWTVRRAGRVRAEQLERRLAALEQAQVTVPVARIRFEYDTGTQLARLHVTNHGAEATFRASLIIEGPLSSRLNGLVFAQWEHTDGPQAQIPRGDTRTLRLAWLDLSSFPFAQWCVYTTAADDGAAALYAMHASVIGGSPDAQAPPIFLDVAILSTPESESLCACIIALQPFEAQRLRA